MKSETQKIIEEFYEFAVELPWESFDYPRWSDFKEKAVRKFLDSKGIKYEE